MGQVYSVTAKLKFNNEEDKESARMALVDYIKKCMEDGTRFDTMEDGNEQMELFDSFEGVMNIILSDQDFSYDAETDSYDSNFEATYSWQILLEDCFHLISPYLLPDSCMTIEPDSGFWLYKANGDERGIDYCINPFFDCVEDLFDHLEWNGDLYNSKRRVYVKRTDDNIYVMELSEEEAKDCIDNAYKDDKPWSDVVSYLPKTLKQMSMEEFEEYYSEKDFEALDASEDWVPAEPLTKILLEGAA